MIKFVTLCVLAVSQLNVSNDTIIEDHQRLGINLGAPNDYGAENWLRNMIPNPGFEPGLWGSVVTTRGATDTTVVQADNWDTRWNTPNIGWPIGHWNDAEWEIPLQNLSGKVVEFTHKDNRLTFVLDQKVSLDWHEPLLLRKSDARSNNPPRPDSPGVQSRKISYPGNTWQTVGTTYFDTYARQGDSSAGTLRCLRGPHTFSFWAKSTGASISVEVTLARYPNAPTLFKKIFNISSDWARYELNFDPDEEVVAGLAPMLTLSWRFTIPGEALLLDDMFLGPKGEGTFTDELVSALDYLHPGAIRGWQGHGDSLYNLLANDFARSPREYRVRQSKATAYGYNLYDLIDLCEKVNAIPWVVLPPTLSDNEMKVLNSWLKEYGKPIYVEFGNESWGSNNPGSDPFAGASFDGGVWLGKVAHDKLSLIAAENAIKIIGGQAAWEGQNQHIRENSSSEYIIPVAPYYGYLNNAWSTPEEMFYPLYAKAFSFPERPYSFGVYEINFHTTAGAGGNNSFVNTFITSQAGGLSLPLHMLLLAEHYGWVPQSAFVLSQYSAGTKVWGIYRDIMATGRVRGTGHALALANRAISGDMVATTITDIPTQLVPAINGLKVETELPLLKAFGWRDGIKWSAIVFNLSMTSDFEVDAGIVEQAEILTAENPTDTNEDAQLFSIQPYEWNGIIPAHSMVLLRGEDSIVTIKVPRSTKTIIIEVEQ